MQQSIKSLNVTQEQLDHCERIIDENKRQVFYLVESMSHPGTHYKVIFDREHKCLRCLPHDGEACPASVAGAVCWHLKAAYAHAQAYKAEQSEQVQIEEYVRQGHSREVAQRVVYAKPTIYTEQQILIAGYDNQREPFSILR